MEFIGQFELPYETSDCFFLYDRPSLAPMPRLNNNYVSFPRDCVKVRRTKRPRTFFSITVEFIMPTTKTIEIAAHLKQVHRWSKSTCEWAAMYYNGSCNYSFLQAILGPKRAAMVAKVR